MSYLPSSPCFLSIYFHHLLCILCQIESNFILLSTMSSHLFIEHSFSGLKKNSASSLTSLVILQSFRLKIYPRFCYWNVQSHVIIETANLFFFLLYVGSTQPGKLEPYQTLIPSLPNHSFVLLCISRVKAEYKERWEEGQDIFTRCLWWSSIDISGSQVLKIASSFVTTFVGPSERYLFLPPRVEGFPLVDGFPWHG